MWQTFFINMYDALENGWAISALPSSARHGRTASTDTAMTTWISRRRCSHKLISAAASFDRGDFVIA